MLTIRLSRIGKKNKPMYRLVISEKARDPYGRALEILGSYNPYTKELVCKDDRINYWIGQGSGMSNTVNNLLIEKGIIKGKKVKATKLSKKKRARKKEKVEEKTEVLKVEVKKEEPEIKEETKQVEDKKKEKVEEKEEKKVEVKKEEKPKEDKKQK